MDAASSVENEQTIIQWLQQNAILIQHIEAGNGFDDFQPLKTILKDAKVVGLGEATHGTREIFQLKYRLLEFLVTEMDFTVFAVEGSFAGCQPINDYVLYGKGDRATVLTGQGYVAWDTEETSVLLDWMRAYNQTIPDEKKVRVCGVDILRNENGRKAVLDYLRKVDPDTLTTAEPLFESIATAEAKWPLRLDEETRKAMIELIPQVQDLIDHLTVNKDKFVSHSSLVEFDLALQYMRVMKQWLIANTADLLPPSASKLASRTIFMAENLVFWMNQARPDAKFIFSGHNGHVSLNDVAIEERNIGCYLREQY